MRKQVKGSAAPAVDGQRRAKSTKRAAVERRVAKTNERAAADANVDVHRLAKLVREEGALAKSALAKHGVAKARLTSVLAALATMGLEIGPKHVRVPLMDQLATRIADAEVVPLRGLENAVAGASRRDVLLAADELVAAGLARKVVRTSEVVLVSPRAATLTQRELGRLEETIVALRATLAATRKHAATLLRVDLDAALRRAMPPRSVTPHGGRSPARSRELVRDRRAPLDGGFLDIVPAAPSSSSGLAASTAVTAPALAAIPVPLSASDVADLVDMHREPSGLTYLPNLVRALGGAAARDAVHAELLRGARMGRFELRPESGMGRLSPEDASLCIPGPQGSRLSWVRRLEEPSS